MNGSFRQRVEARRLIVEFWTLEKSVLGGKIIEGRLLTSKAPIKMEPAISI
jgi:hypothetical protein